MKKAFILAVVAIAFSGFSVAREYSPPDRSQHSQFETTACKSFDLHSLAFTAVAVLPDVISVGEPEYTICSIDYVYVEPVLEFPTQPESRCNGPPAGINT